MNIDHKTDSLICEKMAELDEEFAGGSETELYANVADYFSMKGDADRAIACLRGALELNDSATARFHLARELIRNGDYREGGRELEICSDMDSVELAGASFGANNLYYIAYALFQTERYKEAAEAFMGAQNLINIWSTAMTLKKFHLHQGFSWHLCQDYMQAAESYRRALIAPGPGDSCDEDVMDEDEVENAQQFNDVIEPYLELASMGRPILEAPQDLKVIPDFP